MARRKTQSGVIGDFISLHGDRYNYDLVEYKNTHTNVKIVCPIHGVFEQTPSNHLSGQTCRCCSIQARATPVKDWVTRCSVIHDSKYDYSLVEYTNTYTKVTIICPIHGKFKQSPGEHLKYGCDMCSKCSGQADYSTWLLVVMDFHHSKYDYSLVQWVNSKTKVKIICPVHGEFSQKPIEHKKYGCKLCANDANRVSIDSFILDSNAVHDDKYDYSLVEYSRYDIPVNIICPTHGIFLQRPGDHKIGNGCPACTSVGYSSVCIDWLESVMITSGIYIQHKLNGGEYSIPGTKWRADGYCKETNTIYEFHGSHVHGNPRKYQPIDTPHPWNGKTASELYENTKTREREIVRLGYNLVVMWDDGVTYSLSDKS